METEVSINSYHAFVSIFGFIEVVFAIIVFIRGPFGRYSLFPFFLISFFIFLLSQQFLDVLGVKTIIASIYNIASIQEVTVVTAYTLMFLSAFVCGAFIFKNQASKKHVVDYHTYEDERSVERIVLKNSKILFFITLFPALYYLIFLLRSATNIGYEAIFENSGNLLLRVCGYCEKICIFSLFGFILMSKDKVAVVLSYIAIAFVSIIGFRMGDRAFPTALLLALVWIYLNYNERKSSVSKGNRYIIGLAIIITLIVVFPLIQAARADKNSLISYNMISEAYGGFGIGIFDMLVLSIGALGFSASSLIYTRQFVPFVSPFRYGSTYFWAFTMLIPNIMSPLGVHHIGAEKASLAKWLMNIMDLNYGPGYSMVAEAYINFSFFALPFVIIIGYYFAKFLTPKISIVTGKFSKYHLLVCIGIFITSITMPRRDLGNPLRDVIYTILPLILIMRLGKGRNYFKIKVRR